MASVLHLVTGDPELAMPIIARQIEAGDSVTVAVVHGAGTPPLPAGTTVHRVPADLTYDHLLDLMFSADQVIAW
jgi:hypothetical protein